MQVVVIGSSDWANILEQMTRQADAQHSIAESLGTIADAVSDQQELKDLVNQLKDRTHKLEQSLAGAPKTGS